MIYNGIILNDYADAPYAEWVRIGKKKIETRMNRLFSYRGDIVICCGKTNSVSKNAGKAICIVEIWKGRNMLPEDVEDACIEWHKDRKSLLLRNWKHFNYDFEFSNLKVSGAWQSIFQMTIPDDVVIIPKPEIEPHKELQISATLFT